MAAGEVSPRLKGLGPGHRVGILDPESQSLTILNLHP